MTQVFLHQIPKRLNSWVFNGNAQRKTSGVLIREELVEVGEGPFKQRQSRPECSIHSPTREVEEHIVGVFIRIITNRVIPIEAVKLDQQWSHIPAGGFITLEEVDSLNQRTQEMENEEQLFEFSPCDQ